MVAENTDLKLKRPPLARMAFLADLMRNYQPFTASGIARKLECSRKTIQRDLDFMRDRLHWPVEYDRELCAFQMKGVPPDPLI